MTRLPGSQKRLELHQDLTNPVSDVGYGIRDPESILEGYRNGTWELHVHFGFWVARSDQDHSCQFCALFHNNGADRREDYFLDKRFGRYGHTVIFVPRQKDDELPVLVLAREISEDRQRMTRTGLASVRLVSLHDCPVIVAQSGETVVDDGRGMLGILNDGPVNSVGLLDVSVSARLEQLPREVIQGRTEVVEDIAHNQRPIGWQGSDYTNTDDEMPCGCVFLELGDERGLRLSVHPGLQLSVDFVGMDFRPVPLSPSVIEDTAHGV